MMSNLQARRRTKQILWSKGDTDNTVRAGHGAIVAYHEPLANAAHAKRKPHPVQCSFVNHLAEHLIILSFRFTGRIGR
jgi:hypothetical protein